MTQDPASHSVDEAPSRVRYSRAPRYPVFLLSGAVVGLVVATVVAIAAPDPGDYTRGTLWGYLIVGLGVVGALLGGVVALVAEKLAGSTDVAVTREGSRDDGTASDPHR